MKAEIAIKAADLAVQSIGIVETEGKDNYGEMIKKYEGQANAYAKKNIGVNFGDVDKVVSTADRLAKYLPSN